MTVPISDGRPPVMIEMHVEAFADSRDETLEVDRDEWDAMTPAQREALAQQAVDEFAANYVSWGWHIFDPDDYAAATGGPADSIQSKPWPKADAYAIFSEWMWAGNKSGKSVWEAIQAAYEAGKADVQAADSAPNPSEVTE